jgi:hypothetical protein
LKHFDASFLESKFYVQWNAVAAVASAERRTLLPNYLVMHVLKKCHKQTFRVRQEKNGG